MPTERPEVWERLEAEALHKLLHAQLLEPREAVRRLSPVLRVWEYPAFSAYRSWTLFGPSQDQVEAEQILAREVTWDRPAAGNRFCDPLEGLRQGFHARPQLRVSDSGLPLSEYQALMEEGSRIYVPVIGTEEVTGLDGVTFGIAASGCFGSSRLEWWCDGPAEWQTFTRWAERLRTFLARCFETDPSSNSHH